MPDLERSLRALAAEIDYPPTPDLARNIQGRSPFVASPRRRAPRPTRTLLFAAVAMLAAAATAVAVVSRDDPKSVTIRVVDRLPETRSGEPVPRPLGDEVTPGEARERAGFRVLVPREAPDRVFFSGLVQGGAVTFDYGDVIVTEFEGFTDRALVGKLATPRTRIERFRLDGEPAIWMTGAPHAVYVQDSEGEVFEETLRLAGNVLLAERGDVLVRVEGEDISRAEAVRRVRSLR